MATLIEFNLAGRVFERVQPRGFAEFTARLDAYAATLAQARPSLAARIVSSVGVDPQFIDANGLARGVDPQFAGVPRSFFPELRGEESLRGPQISMMAKKDGEPLPILAAPAPASNDLSHSRTEMRRTVSSIVMKTTAWREIMEMLPMPVLVTDAAGLLTYANPRGQAFWSSPHDMLRLGIEDIFEPVAERPGLFRPRKEGIQDQIWEISEKRLETGDGRVHFLTDRTPEWQLQERLGTVEGEKARLAAKDHLVQTILHNQTHTLQGALSQGEMISRILERPTEIPAAEGREATSSRWDMLKGRATHFGRATRHALEGILNLRDLMKGGRQKQILSLEPLLETALALNEGMRVEKGIRLRLEFAKDLVVIGEQVPLVESVLNLLVNACDALHSGGELSLRTYSAGSMNVIEVRDSGTGIAPEHLPFIFDSGFTTKRSDGGSGFGLHHVKWAIENLHHGRVEVQSDVGMGTTFRFYLPTSTSLVSPR